MEPFHYPPTRFLGGVTTASLCSILVYWANMRDILVLIDNLLCFSSQIGGIQTQMLWSFLARLWAGNHDGIEGWSSQSSIMNVCPLYCHSEGQPMSLAQLTPLGSPFCAIGRIGSGRASASRGFGHDAIQTLPFPIQSDQFIILLQSILPQLHEQPLFFPQTKTIIDSS
jgi:hypothetical protein